MLVKCFRGFVVLSIMFFVSSTYAQKTVVVIPLFGDDAASKWRGEWAVSIAYKTSDIIEFNGSSYIAVVDHFSDLSNMPPDTAAWDLVASSGANGMNGLEGTPGLAGPPGPPGQDSISAVTSINTQVGAVVLDTGDVTEGNNLYFTNVRADSRVNAQKGSPLGVASLDVSGKLPISQVPATGINADELGGIDSTGFALIAQGVRSIGSNNTAAGNNALGKAISVSRSTAFGTDALNDNLEGDFNTAVGEFALKINTGSSNVGLGADALGNNFEGDSNTAVGDFSLFSSLGNNNTALGKSAGSQLVAGDNNLYLDNDGVATESNTVRIGDTQEKAFIKGISGVTPAGATNTVVINASGQLGTSVDAVSVVCIELGAAADCDLTAVISSLASPIIYAVGDFGPAGGIVLSIYAGGVHGIEAGLSDSARSPWGCYLTEIPGAAGTVVGSGAQNTSDIVAGCVSAEVTAAEVATAYSANGFDDWHLPSKDELDLLLTQIDVVGVERDVPYWSSSQINSDVSWRIERVLFNTLNFNAPDNALKSDVKNVRVVRAF
jgi:hypothetical protein